MIAELRRVARVVIALANLHIRRGCYSGAQLVPSEDGKRLDNTDAR